MRFPRHLIGLVAVISLTAAGAAQENRAPQPRPAVEEHRAPVDWGFARPENEFPRVRYRESETTRTSIRLPEGVSQKLKGSSPTGRLITVEVTMVEAPVVGNGREMSVEKIAELEKAGKLVSQSRYWVSLVENQVSELQFGERVQVVVGRTNLGGSRGVQESSVYEEVGTKLSMVGRVDGDSVLVQMDLNQTRLIPAPAKAEGDNSESVARPRNATTTFKSTLTILPGKTVVAGGRETQTDKGIVQTWLLVSAHAEDKKPEAAAAEPIVKIFRLINAKAESLAPIMQGIFAHDNLQIAVDARTNNIIARGDEKTLQILYRLLTVLDEQFEEKKPEAKK
ncbi:MAG: secretin N-terminal domain-containing protein [Pirellulaceae bacterium]